MEDWLSQLEMAWNDEAMLLSNNNNNQEIDTLGEELAAVLGEDFSFLPHKTTVSSLLNYCTSENPTNLLSDQPIFFDDDQQLVISQLLLDHDVSSHNQNADNSSRDSSSKSITKSSQHVQVQDQNLKITNGSRKDAITNNNNTIDEQVTKGGRKRRRDPEQVHCHIIAERKRRELLTQRFIALSAMVPGLKKVDKTSILEEAIKHLGEMKDKVKVLEEAATSKQNMGRSVMVVKRTHLILDDNDNVSDSSAVSCLDDTSSEDTDGHKRGELPEIEAKISRKTLLLKICCVNGKGILAKIYVEVERFQMSILNSTAVTFEDSALDITILAEMEASRGYDEQVKDLVRALHSVLRMS